jgi:hypothetical protein
VVEWTDSGGTGNLTITSGSFGSNSAVSVAADVAGSAADLLGLSGASSVNGLNVEGTIRGEAAMAVASSYDLESLGLMDKITNDMLGAWSKIAVREVPGESLPHRPFQAQA